MTIELIPYSRCELDDQVAASMRRLAAKRRRQVALVLYDHNFAKWQMLQDPLFRSLWRLREALKGREAIDV